MVWDNEGSIITGVNEGYEPYEGASDNPISVDVLRITQDPITEKDESSWTRSWFVEKNLASASDELERLR